MSHPAAPPRPPTTTRHLFARRLKLGLFAVALVGIGLVFPFPDKGRIWGQIFDLAHAPTFCGTFLVIIGLLDPPAIGISRRFPTIMPMTFNRTIIVALLLSVVGTCGEALQYFSGRNPSLKDVMANSAGLLTGFVWVNGPKTTGVKRLLSGLTALLIIAAVSFAPVLNTWDCAEQVRQMPLMASFEHARELSRWESADADMARSTEWSTDGAYSLRVDLEPARYPLIALVWPFPDWQGYQKLTIDFRNPGDSPLTLTIKVQDRDHTLSDRGHSDRFDQDVLLAPGAVRNLTILIEDIRQAPAERLTRMDQIARVEIFAHDLQHHATFYVDNMRLQ